MTAVLLVTGATGTVGQHVVAALADRDVAVRSGVRDPETASTELADAGDVVKFDFAKPETWGDALADVDGVFLMRPPAVSEADVNSFVDAADRVGVNHVVYLSTLGAEKNVIIPHHRIEKHIMGTDITYTLLRASFFMQNLLEVHRADIVEHDELFVPAGSGKTSFIDARDISEAAAVVLIEPDHANRAYDLTGPEALDYGAVATTFSEVLGRSITYPNPSLLAFSRRNVPARNTTRVYRAAVWHLHHCTARVGRPCDRRQLSASRAIAANGTSVYRRSRRRLSRRLPAGQDASVAGSSE